ncbi:MAG: AMP-binding protein [Thermodesulfobacteriota bacterium]
MIRTKIRAENPNANMKSYYHTCKEFSWDDVERQFPGYDPTRTNVAVYASDRWADDPDKKRHWALVFEKGGKVETISYLDLKEQSCKWANLLASKGFQKGDRLFVMLPPCPEAYFTMVACARLGVIFCNVYPTLGFDELEWILLNADPRGILTHPDLVERLSHDAVEKVAQVLLTGESPAGIYPTETLAKDVMDDMPSDFTNVLLPCESPLYILYTSGSTGPPKGVVHAHEDMLGHLITAKYVLDLTSDSVLWTNGDPAWVLGTVYGAFAPWLCGSTTMIQGDPFSASTLYRTLERHRVSIWYTTPLTIHRLMEAGDDLPARYDFSHLRHVCCVGEALVPDLFFWVKEYIGLAPHDTWWMTETGMICIANFPSEQVRPGSMGKPVPGVEAAVLDLNGEPLPILTMGELALKVGWPSMMRGIWRDEQRYAAYFRNGWFLTGDMVIKDEDGYYTHQGRNDDLIKVEQKFIGPYEIEAVICMHPAVAEAAAIAKGTNVGKPKVKAFVTLNRGLTRSARLNHEIRAFVKANLHSDVPLSEVEFVDELPKTRSGKLLRRVLRARELGLPSGDHSKLQE